MKDTEQLSLSELSRTQIKPAKLSHLILRTPNFKEMKEWYAQVLGATPTFENAQVCFLTYDDEHHRVGFINMPQLQLQGGEDAGMDHFAFNFATLPRLLATFLRLKRLGIVPYWTINHGPTISFHYRDPDGNKVELEYDVFPTTEEVRAFFASGAYEENFLGIIIDPEEMIRSYEAGTPVEELTRRPKLPPGKTPWDMHRK